MELTREVLEFCAAAGCPQLDGCEGCVCEEKDGEGFSKCAAPEYEDLAALALSLMDERDRFRKALETIIAAAPTKYEPDCEYWDWGNYDDAYGYGVDTGYFRNAETARAALEPR